MLNFDANDTQTSRGDRINYVLHGHRDKFAGALADDLAAHEAGSLA